METAIRVTSKTVTYMLTQWYMLLKVKNIDVLLKCRMLAVLTVLMVVG